MKKPDYQTQSEAYVESIFGAGSGAKHSRFLERIQNPALRELVHRFHLWEADKSLLSLEENYLIGMCVLCSSGALSSAGMFAKVLLHLGTPKEKLLEAVARVAMWSSGLAATEAAFAIQKAIHEYETAGLGSLAAWFPDDISSSRKSTGPGQRTER